MSPLGLGFAVCNEGDDDDDDEMVMMMMLLLMRMIMMMGDDQRPVHPMVGQKMQE